MTGELEYADGTREPVTEATLIGAPEAALQILAGTAVVLAIALLVMRW